MRIAFMSFFLFYSKYSQACSLYYEISDIPILKYVQVNVFGSVNTFIVTVSIPADGRRHVSLC